MTEFYSYGANPEYSNGGAVALGAVALGIKDPVKTNRHIAGWKGHSLPLCICTSADAEMKKMFLKTPRVPPVKVAEILVAYAKHVGATAEALDYLRELVPMDQKEYDYMLNNYPGFQMTKPMPAFAPETGVGSGAPAKAKKAVAAPPKAEKPAKGAKGAAEAPKKGGRPAKEDISDREVSIMKMPKDDVKIPPQMRKILELLHKAGKPLKVKLFLKTLESKLETRQPVERVFDFYKKRMIDEGWLAVSK